MRTTGRRRSLVLATAAACLVMLTACASGGTAAAPTSPTSTVTLTAGTPTTTAAPTTVSPTPIATTVIPTPIATTVAPRTIATPVSPTAAPPAVSSGTTPSPLGPVGLSGVNDPSCTSEQRPVVLLHGTFSTVKSNFAAMTPALRATGRCVFGIDYGSGGVRPVTESAAAMTAFVDEVLVITGADQVDVVAYSQGGLVLRTALRRDGLSEKVAVAVLIAPSFHGSTSTLLNALPAGACPACADQTAGSALLTELDAGGDLDGDVRYAVAASLNDTVVTPISSQVPAGPEDRVRSVVVQDRCPGEIVDHIALPADAGVIAWTVDALGSGGAPDPTALSCR